MRVAIYARVSTDGQSVNSQLEALRKVARRRGWQVVKEYTDAGVSGAKGRDQRPALDAMLKDAVRRRSAGALPPAPGQRSLGPPGHRDWALSPPAGDRHDHR
jgi:hypothetical protein